MGILNIILTMSLIGSIIFILFLGMEQITKRFFSAAWHYNILKCILLFFVIPFGKIADYIIYRWLNKYIFINNSKVSIGINLNYFDISNNNLLWFLSVNNIIIILWSIGIIVFISRQILCYLRFRYIVKNNRKPADKCLCETVEMCAKELGIKKSIMIYVNEYINTPMLVGIMKPVILIQNNNMKMDNAKYIISHELTHYKNKDVIIKFITLLIQATHWFNPFIYLLSAEMVKWCEYACDEKNAINLSHESKKQYGLAILETAAEMTVYSSSFGASLLVPKQNLKKRLMFMINVKRLKKKSMVLSFIVALFIISTGFSVAFATEYYNDSYSGKNNKNYSMNQWTYISNRSSVTSGPISKNSMDALKYNEFIKK